MPDDIYKWAGWLVAAATVIATIVNSRKKNDIDQSTLILGQWKSLVDTHQTDIKAIKEEFALYKSTAITEINDLRTRLVKAENRITELEAENAGLKRAIAQNSQSTAYQLTRSRDRATAGETRQSASDDRQTGMEDELRRIDLAGGNSKGAGV